jgi:hypothetical protein
MPDLSSGDFRKAVLLDPVLFVMRGEPGTSAAAYPNGRPRERLRRWIAKLVRRTRGDR